MFCELLVLPEEASSEQLILFKCLQKLKLSKEEIAGFKIVRRSIDARSKNVKIQLRIRIYLKGETLDAPYSPREFRNVSSAKEVIVAGCGPAGIFAALQLIESGYKPIIIERGKNVRDRRRDLAQLIKKQLVNEHSNYCFGEGGAGTYSDGKLYTRSTKRGNVKRILETFVCYGADENILIDAHPHIGTNRLPAIISNLTEQIIACGGEVHFNTQLSSIEYNGDGVQSIKIRSTETNHESTLPCRALILATGHSARDIFHLLHTAQISIESKPIAIGLRIEHAQSLIDRIQYHCQSRGEFLPPASYQLVYQSEGDKGVYSFCMCPGGIIAPAMTHSNEIVVNGWSPSKRNNPFANSGMVVSIDEATYRKNHTGDLAALLYQQQIEKAAYDAVQNGIQAPAQRMEDFIQGNNSRDIPANSYLPGTKSANFKELLPSEIYAPLKSALIHFGKKMKGYRTNDAVLVGVESRTSSPIRIPRNKDTGMHPQVNGLFPCGEGASYAGGIVSAAMDGENIAINVANYFEG
ncbi:MAG TPA: FAD-binding protein [Bacteroidia bacterium]|nr:FAD-binding protein [Bacteroidia bacterium]HNT79734.1 FAD-binding protein [Bacteroidia bacterium]